jgi:hypothetical protein
MSSSIQQEPNFRVDRQACGVENAPVTTEAGDLPANLPNAVLRDRTSRVGTTSVPPHPPLEHKKGASPPKNPGGLWGRAQAVVKAWVGGDSARARLLRGRFVENRPVAELRADEATLLAAFIWEFGRDQCPNWDEAAVESLLEDLGCLRPDLFPDLCAEKAKTEPTSVTSGAALPSSPVPDGSAADGGADPWAELTLPKVPSPAGITRPPR